MISIERILLSRRDEAQKHVEWMGGTLEFLIFGGSS